VPPNLDKLSPPLRDFVDEFGLDTDLLAAAVVGSENQVATQQVVLAAALNELSKK